MSPVGVAWGARERVDGGFFVGMTQMLMRARVSQDEERVLAAYYLALSQAHVRAAELLDDGGEFDAVVESFCDWRRLASGLSVTEAAAMSMWRSARARVALEIARARP